jgi:hypothetical protein|tara:strand:+ start:299 stop:700 length:402 start_codon:yes stop_codon:yes gene_type:complete
MIDEVKIISFKVEISETFYDGFRGAIPNKKILFNNSQVRDNKSPLGEMFRKGDLVQITLELAKEARQDRITNDSVEFHIAVFQTAENGIYTKDCEDRLKTKLFYQSRGMITSPALKNNPFESGDLIKVKIKKW